MFWNTLRHKIHIWCSRNPDETYWNQTLSGFRSLHKESLSIASDSLPSGICRHPSQLHVKSRNSWARVHSFAVLDGVRCGSIRIFLSVRPRNMEVQSEGQRDEVKPDNPKAKKFTYILHRSRSVIRFFFFHNGGREEN